MATTPAPDTQGQTCTPSPAFTTALEIAGYGIAIVGVYLGFKRSKNHKKKK
jgi:hypothetical protein